jgi:hypothetical protein
MARGRPVARRPVTTTNRLLAVIDEAAAANRAAAALRDAGFPPEAVTVLEGDEDADRIDSLGKVRGPLARVRRLLSFTMVDQMVDLAVYEAALRDGRAVVAVHARAAADRERAKRALAAEGAHFMNFFGRFATEDIARWRGRELPIPRYLRR